MFLLFILEETIERKGERGREGERERERVENSLFSKPNYIYTLCTVPPPTLCMHVMATPTSVGTTGKISSGTEELNF